MSDPGRRSTYVPGLDGLRGVALAGVLLFHAGHLGGGFLSVDLFFVLSGFLITTLLLREWVASGRVDLRAFWARRLRRLVPAALVLLAVVAGYAALELDGGALHRFRWDAIAALLDVANWRAIQAGSDYWSSFGPPSPLRHMWTLSVEEQLYVVWPVVLGAALRAGRRLGDSRYLAGLTALTLAGASAVAMAALVEEGDTARAYYGTDARASAVLLGALAAILLHGRPTAPPVRDGAVRVLGAATPLAIVGLAAAWVQADGESVAMYRGGFVACSAAAAVVIGAVAVGAVPWLVRPLELRPLRHLGRISYGAYLWHWPVFVVLDEPIGGSRAVQSVVRIAISLVLAEISAVLVERPVRDGRVRTRAWRGVGLAGAAGVAALALVVTSGATAEPTGGDGSTELTEGPAGSPVVLLLGDSEAFGLAHGAPAALDGVARFAYHARIGCGLGPGDAVIDDRTVVREDAQGIPCSDAMAWLTLAIDQHQPDLVVVHEGAWDVLDREVDGRRLRSGTPEWAEAVEAQLRSSLTRFGAHGARVVALASPCFEPGGEADGQEVRADDGRVARWNARLRAAAADVGVQVLPYDELFCGVDPADQPEREDGVHLTPAGSEEAWRWLAPRLGLEPAGGP